MSDIYQKVANSSLGKQVVSALNLPQPLILERQEKEASQFLEGCALIGGAVNGVALSTIANVLRASTASLYTLDNSDLPTLADKTALKTQTKVQVVAPKALEDGPKFKALVFDATGIATTESLRAVYDFFKSSIRNIAKCGRLVIVGVDPHSCDDPKTAAAQRALEGFIRSAAKEIGKKAATAQVIYLKPGAENQLESPLRFVLSPRSAYVSGQVITVSKAPKSKTATDWNQPAKGKVALVTGASRGIGEAIARTLSRDGAQVVCLDIPAAQAALESVASSIKGSALTCDITDANAPAQIAQYLKTHFGGVDIVVHNAGITRDKTLGRMPEHFWDMVIDINLSAEERINDALFAEQLMNKNGRIVCVSSIGGIAGNFGQTNYAASKAGVIGYVESLSKQLTNGITINAVAPGFIETQMTAAMPFTIREAGRRMNSMSQGGQPQDVAETIAFFASSASQGVNGNVIRTCGQSLIGK